MDSERNSQPLLDPNSDSEDVNEDLMSEVRRRRTTDSASGSHFGPSSSHSDINDSDTHDIRDLESNTDDFDDDTQNLFKADNTVPSDSCSFTYIIFYLLGTTTLLPWNFFMTAEDVSIRNKNASLHVMQSHRGWKCVGMQSPSWRSFQIKIDSGIRSRPYWINTSFLRRKRQSSLKMNNTIRRCVAQAAWIKLLCD